MNVSTQLLLWCPVQVTVLAIAALGIDVLIGRRRPAVGALVASSALVAIAALTATALCPWPTWALTWDRLPWSHAAEPMVAVAGDPSLDFAMRSRTPQSADEGQLGLLASGRSMVPTETGSFLKRSWAAIVSRWTLFAAALYLAGVTAMAVRIGLGLAAVRRYRRDSRPLADRRLVEFLEAVRVELGGCRQVELRVTAALNTPATVGWRRPILLLPLDWSSWTDDECRAILAHELEHVRRSDFLSWMVAQIGIALHFYHPLVHSLAARLRLKQELAADAAAARVAGGQREYVATLAAMALRQSDALVAWPARAFLPSSKTFLRRIEMLHRSKSLRSEVSRPLFFLSIAAVALAAVCAAGIRGSSADDDREAATGSSAFSAEIKAGDALAADSPVKSFKAMNNLKMLGLAMHNYRDRHKHFPPAVVLGPDGKTPHSWRVELLPFLDQRALYREYRLSEPWDSPANKKVLEKIPASLRSPFDDPKSTNSGYYVITGPGTIFEGAKGLDFADITDGTSNTLLVVESKENSPWTKPEDIPFDPNNPLPKLGGFMTGRFAATIADGSARRFETDNVKDQLKWLIMRNDGHVIDWQKLGVVRGPQSVGRQNSLSATVASLNNSIRANHEANQEKNNLKSLALAMHNYRDVHGHFPPAVVMDPDGKTPHSWRVELLPYLNLKALYDEYRMNEPWDSPENTKVLEQIPYTLRSPYDNPRSTNSGYFVLVGPGTVFEGSTGVRIQDITDGTSNTILIVGAKRNIPWTKPEDIPFDPEKSLPALGGFTPGSFAAAMADGACRFFRTERVQDQLKWLILRNDGHSLPPADLGRPNAP